MGSRHGHQRPCGQAQADFVGAIDIHAAHRYQAARHALKRVHYCARLVFIAGNHVEHHVRRPAPEFLGVVGQTVAITNRAAYRNGQGWRVLPAVQDGDLVFRSQALHHARADESGSADH